jgi:hypothetical protein
MELYSNQSTKNSWSTAILEKCSAIQGIPCLSWSLKFQNNHVQNRKPYPEPDKTISSHKMSLKSNLMFFSDLHIYLPSHLFPCSSLTEIYYALLIDSMTATCLTH